MNLEPYRSLFADLERERDLAEAKALLAEARHTIAQLDLAIANYQDAWLLQHLPSLTDRMS